MSIKKNDKTRTKREYIKFSDAVGSAVYLENGDVWMNSGNKPEFAPGVTINTSDVEALSDYTRHVTLKDVTVLVGKRKGSNGKYYPELIIQGGNCEDVPF